VTLMLGAAAARSLLGRTITIANERGRAIELDDGSTGWVTVHPSFLLRMPDKATAAEEYTRFVEGLKAAWKLTA
jgi:DNA polymerase